MSHGNLIAAVPHVHLGADQNSEIAVPRIYWRAPIFQIRKIGGRIARYISRRISIAMWKQSMSIQTPPPRISQGRSHDCTSRGACTHSRRSDRGRAVKDLSRGPLFSSALGLADSSHTAAAWARVIAKHFGRAPALPRIRTYPPQQVCTRREGD